MQYISSFGDLSLINVKFKLIKNGYGEHNDPYLDPISHVSFLSIFYYSSTEDK